MNVTLEQFGPIMLILLGLGTFAIKQGKSMFYGVDAGARLEQKVEDLSEEVKAGFDRLSRRIDILVRSHGEPK